MIIFVLEYIFFYHLSYLDENSNAHLDKMKYKQNYLDTTTWIHLSR